MYENDDNDRTLLSAAMAHRGGGLDGVEVKMFAVARRRMEDNRVKSDLAPSEKVSGALARDFRNLACG